MGQRRTLISMWGLFLVLVLITALFSVPSGDTHVALALGSTWMVTTTADNVNNATCSTTCTLRQAINAANANTASPNTIQFAAGVTGTISLNSTFGTLTLSNTAKPTTIAGPGAANLAIDGGFSVQVFAVSSGVTATLSSLTVQHGTGSGSGAGLYTSGTLAILYCVFANNPAPNNGGGLYVNSGTVTIQGSIFSGNATSAAGNGGGGLYVNSGTVTIQNSTFSGNYASTGYVLGQGGGAYNAGTLTIQNSTFSGNTATVDGAGGVYNAGTLTIESSTFSGNNASSGAWGGGVYNNGGTATIQNSTFFNNYAGSGGGVENNATLTIQNSTFSANAANSGDGIFNAGTLYVGSNIVAGNSASDIYNNPGAPITTLGHNLVGVGMYSGLTNGVKGDQVGSSGSPINPQLGALANNGGPTQTMAITSSSPAYANGDCALSAPAVPISTDQRGAGYFRRSPCDTGAFEVETATTTTANPASGTTGNAITLSATVSPAVNAGTVTFSVYQDSAQTKPIGNSVTSGTVSGGAASASFTFTNGELGRYFIKAVYSGAAGYATSASTAPGNLDAFVPSNSALTVGTLTDPASNANCHNTYVAACGLRTAMEYAASGDTINFSMGGTLTLSSTLPTVTTTLAINGVGAANLVIDGGYTGVSGTGVQVFVVNSGATLTLSNLTVRHGYAPTWGGAVYNSGTVTISNSTFSGNVSNGSLGAGGGTVFNKAGGTVTISSSTFSGNSAPGGTGSSGGAVLNNGTLTISNSTFSANFTAAGGYGGGVDNSGTLTITGSTFSGNSAAASSAGGGYGGGVFNAGTTATISNSTFSGNTANGGYGGGVYNGGVLTISNSTFYGNSASNGYGGGIGSIFATLNLGSTIIAGNIANGGSGPDIYAVVSSLGSNLIGNISGASGFVSSDQQNVNPNMNALGNYGGPTQTFLLQFGSPAIGKGNCALGAPAVSVSTDQRGVTRKASGPGCDVGAFEDFGLNPATLPNAVAGTPYLQAIAASGGTSPYTFNVLSGPLPSGISLTGTGTLQGTTNQTGSFPFTFQVSDASSDIVQWGYTLNVKAGTDSIGVFRPSARTFYLRLNNSTGYADITDAFGPGANPYPVVGDWLGQGFDTIGTFDRSNGLFTLCTANDTTLCTNSASRITFVLGTPNDMPLSGRWLASATHAGVGVFRPSNGLIYLKNSLATGVADYTMVLGIPGDVGLAGDWTGKGYDSPGVYRPSNSNFYLSNQVCNSSVFADIQFAYGIGGDSPVVGDWIGQGHDGVGLFRQSNGYTYLRNTLTTGYADIAFVYGIAGDMPVAGHWQLTYPPVTNPGSVSVPPTPVPSGSSVIPTGVGD